MTITDANTSRQNEENTEQIMENTAIDTQNITNIDNTAQLDSQSESIIEVRHLGKIFGTHEVLKRHRFRCPKRRRNLHNRLVGQRKIHTFALYKPLRDANVGANLFPRRRRYQDEKRGKISRKSDDGFSIVQSLQQSQRACKLHYRSSQSVENKKGRGKRRRNEISRTRGHRARISTQSLVSFRAVKNNAWQLRAPLRCPPKSSCLTSPLPLSIPKWWAKCSKS